MDRRRVLQTVSTALAAAIAGCSADDGSPTRTATATDTATPSATATDSPTPSRTSTATGSPTESPTDSPTGTPSETPPGTPSDTPGGASTDAPADTEPTDGTATPSLSPSQTVVVGPEGTLRFDPPEFTVSVGDTVRWEWDSSGHNVRPDSTPAGSSWTGTPGGDDTTYDAGYAHSHTFEAAGTYDYYCAPHQQFGMTGSFTVE